MAPYIFGARNSIYIINLEKTLESLKTAREFLKGLAIKGETILFVGTKKQAQAMVAEQAKACGMPHVSSRWLGGLLTNFSTIKKSVARLKDIDKMKEDGRLANFTKKEVGLMMRERGKLENSLGGIKDMERLPAALFVVDSKKEELAVAEARKLGIPVAGLIDTNCNPELIDYPIPGNDDAIKSIKLIISLVAESIAEGRKGFLDYLTQASVKPDISEIQGPSEGAKVESEDIKVKEEIVELAEKVAGVDNNDASIKHPLKTKPADSTFDAKNKRRIKK